MKKNSILKNLSKSIALLTVIVIVFGMVSVPVSADAEPTEEVIIENTEAIETEARRSWSAKAYISNLGNLSQIS